VQPCVVGTWTRTSRQDTRPTADNAGVDTAEKNPNISALRSRLSLDNRRPHKG
jgi:hypothetical protein